jgi:hypothetical protein
MSRTMSQHNFRCVNKLKKVSSEGSSLSLAAFGSLENVRKG